MTEGLRSRAELDEALFSGELSPDERRLAIRESNALSRADYLRQLYRATGNRLIFWQLFLLYREAQLPIPDDVLRDLDRVAKALQTASGTKEIALALGMTGSKGGAQAGAALEKARRRIAILTDVRDGLDVRAGRWPKAATYAQVAKRHGTTAIAVKKAWLEFLRERKGRARRPKSNTFDALVNALHPRPARRR